MSSPLPGISGIPQIMASGVGDISITDDGDALVSSGAGTTTHTFTSQSSTGPHSLLLITWFDNNSGSALNSLTWGGVSMSILVNVATATGDGVGAAIAYIAGAQTGNVVMTFSAGVNESTITKVSLSGLNSATAVDTDTATGSGATIDLTALASPGTGGIRLCAWANLTDPTGVTWTNATELSDIDAGSYQHSGAYDLGPNATTITADGATAQQVLVGVSLR